MSTKIIQDNDHYQITETTGMSPTISGFFLIHLKESGGKHHETYDAPDQRDWALSRAIGYANAYNLFAGLSPTEIRTKLKILLEEYYARIPQIKTIQSWERSKRGLTRSALDYYWEALPQ
jgi:hypothetical protein